MSARVESQALETTLTQKSQREELWLEAEGPTGVFAILEEDNGTGYFCAYRPSTRTVLGQVCVYVRSKDVQIDGQDVRVMWSSDQTKCGAAIWGRMRAVLDVANGRELCMPLESRRSPAVTDAEWLEGFEYLDLDHFVRARQRYWKEIAKEREPGTEPLREDQTPIETNFIRYAGGSNNTFAVFEDDGDSGYLYIYSSAEQTVLRFLHVYDRSQRLEVTPGDVEVVRATGRTKCGVAIWGEMRGIIDLAGGVEGRVWMESRDTPGVGDQKWLEGF